MGIKTNVTALVGNLKRIADCDSQVCAQLDAHLERFMLAESLITEGHGSKSKHLERLDLTEFFLKTLLTSAWQLPVPKIYEVIRLFSSVFDPFYKLAYSDEYRALVDQLPGGRTFTTVNWNATNPSRHGYLSGEMNARQRIPSSFRYTNMCAEGWSGTLRIARHMNAFGCSHSNDNRSRVTFYFADESDELLMRMKYPGVISLYGGWG